MTEISSVFIVQPGNEGWIIERLLQDIAKELSGRGIRTTIGNAAHYNGEQIVFNSRFLTPHANERASINSLFVTHVDDRIKELELRNLFGRFHSFVCLSPQDADFVAGLKGDRQGVVGIDLPARDLRVRPLRTVVFSARYEDGRKNERWILEYFQCRSTEYRSAFVWEFLGWGWESFAEELANLDVNYEIRRYSRFNPNEYDLYKRALPEADALIYTGFDGGAMSVYDGISAGIDVVASDTSYHRGLGEAVRLFASREDFFAELDRLYFKRATRVQALSGRSISAYVDKLLDHWKSLFASEPVKSISLGERETRTVSEFRHHYKRIGASRLRSALIRWIQSKLFGS